MVFINLDTGENDSSNIALDCVQFAAFERDGMSLTTSFGCAVGYGTVSSNNAVEIEWTKRFFMERPEDYLHLDWVSHVIGDFFIKIDQIGAIHISRNHQNIVEKADIYLKSNPNSPEITVYADEEDEGRSLRAVLEVLNE